MTHQRVQSGYQAYLGAEVDWRLERWQLDFHLVVWKQRHEIWCHNHYHLLPTELSWQSYVFRQLGKLEVLWEFRIYSVCLLVGLLCVLALKWLWFTVWVRLWVDVGKLVPLVWTNGKNFQHRLEQMLEFICCIPASPLVPFIWKIRFNFSLTFFFLGSCGVWVLCLCDVWGLKYYNFSGRQFFRIYGNYYVLFFG